MRHSIRFFLLCLITAFIAGCDVSNLILPSQSKPDYKIAERSIPSEEPTLSRSWTSDNFIVRADLPVDMAYQLVKDLEHFRYSLLEIHDIKPREVEPPLEIIFTNEVEDYLSFKMGESSVAFYSPSILGRKIIVDTSRMRYDPNALWDTIFHEYVHHFNASYLPYATPLWLNEGAAEYFSSFRNIEENRFEYGHPREVYLSVLTSRPNDWPDMIKFVQELVAYPIIPGFFGEAAQERQFYYYALSWLMFHWSQNTEDGQAAFQNLKEALDQGRAVEDAFPQDLNDVLFRYTKSIDLTPKTYVSEVDREDLIDISFAELTETEYAARLYAQLAFDPGSILKPERMSALRQTFKEDESLKAYDLLSLSLLSLELGRINDAKHYILEAEKTAPDDINLLRFSVVIHTSILAQTARLRVRRIPDDSVFDIMGRYTERNPGDIDIDFRVMSLKGRFRQSLGRNRLAAFNRIKQYEHHKRNPMQALYLVYPLMDKQEFDEAERILARAELWNDDAQFAKTIDDMKEDLKYNRIVAAEVAQ